MPELPEVQTLVNDLNAAGLIGKTITAARVYWPRSIALPKLSAGASKQKPFGIFGAVANLSFLTSPLITISSFTFV
jgi:hypothetical protein